MRSRLVPLFVLLYLLSVAAPCASAYLHAVPPSAAGSYNPDKRPAHHLLRVVGVCRAAQHPRPCVHALHTSSQILHSPTLADHARDQRVYVQQSVSGIDAIQFFDPIRFM